MFLLSDADPYGIDILLVYAFGSKGMSYDSENLTIPSIRWLGVLQSDFDKFNIPENCVIPLTEADKKYGSSMLNRLCFQTLTAWR